MGRRTDLSGIVMVVLLVVVVALALPLFMEGELPRTIEWILGRDPFGGVIADHDSDRSPVVPGTENGSGQDEPVDRDPEVPADADVYPEFAAEHLQVLNRERQSLGLPPLVANRQLSDVAVWVATVQAETGEAPDAVEIKKKLAPYPELAVTPFAVNRVWAVSEKGDRFFRWFADGRNDDAQSSEALRENLLSRDFTQVALACVGVSVQAEYRLVFVWFFMQEPPSARITNHTDISAENIAILNRERSGRSLGSLRTHTGLNDLAYLKAKDILESLPYNGLDHESERLGSPHEMMLAYISPQPRGTAENLWTQWGGYHTGFLANTAEQAHDGLMNSEGHRKNMLHPDFTHIGVGTAAGIVDGFYKVVLVQLFIIE